MNEDRNTLASATNVIPPSTLSISEEAQLAFGNAPPYFRHFMDLFQKTDARNIAFLLENTNAIKGLATRVDSLENKYEKHSAVRKDVAAVTAANEAQAQRLTLDDPREIVVRGIPASAALTPPTNWRRAPVSARAISPRPSCRWLVGVDTEAPCSTRRSV